MGEMIKINMKLIIRKIGAIVLALSMILNNSLVYAQKDGTTKYKIGDLNGDGNVDSKDYTILEDYLLGKIDKFPIDESNLKYSLSDLNGDNKTTSTDLALMKRYILGKINKFSVEGGLVISVKDMNVHIYQGENYSLPNTIMAIMYDGSNQSVPVNWNTTKIDTNKIGSTKVLGTVDGYNELVVLNVEITEYIADKNLVSGYVNGIENQDIATITIGNERYVKSVKTDTRGFYSFRDIPDGEYYVKIDLTGYKNEKSKTIKVSKNNIYVKNSNSKYENVAHVDFEVTPIAEDKFIYHWEYDGTISGYEESANINEKPIINFIDEEVEIGDSASIEKLLHKYKIILSDENIAWSQEYSFRLLDTIESIPQEKVLFNTSTSIVTSKFILTDEHITNDINIRYSEKGNIVTISTDAFVNSTPKLADIDGIKGKFFSKRLHHAMVRYVTKNGTDLSAVEKILNERFGCSIMIPSYEELTKYTTQEDEHRFQQFKPEELINIINMFEEMPQGLHAVKGLKYLARRAEGMRHPMYPSAPAVAWPTAMEESYIEFMDDSFMGDESYIHRLIIHEKAHFMWENLFSDEIKKMWIEVGGWYENPDDPDGWSTTKTTEFVSDYAHKKNPDEDMAETISYYIINPEKLKSRSINKYNFVRDYIMHGDIYLSQIRDDLTFEVLNLYPDYNYPGKIKRIDISADGNQNEDKTITVEIELNNLDNVFDGAKHAYTRIYSDIGTFYDLYMYPINEDKSILRGEIIINNKAKSGYWNVDQIVVTDEVGNQRFEGVNDFGWLLYINNEQEDVTPPKYVPNSMELKLVDDEVEGRKVRRLNASWEVDEDVAMKEHQGVFGALVNKDTKQDRKDKWGSYDNNTKRASIDYYLTEYMPSGRYGLSWISMVDKAENTTQYNFSESPNDENMTTVNIFSTNPDVTKPELDLNKIYISARPTNPQAPDGETIVDITYYARDDKSGLGEVTYVLRDPQGINHRQYHYHENFETVFFKGDPTAWKEYKINTILPRGSAPGIWGLEELNISDKAGNRQNNSFLENIHFEVGNKTINTKVQEIATINANLSIGNIDAKQGEEVSIPVNIENVSNEVINNFNYGISYDKESLELLSVTPGEGIISEEDFKYNVTNDYMIYLLFNDKTQEERSIQGSSNIAYMNFKVKNDATGGKKQINFAEDGNRVEEFATLELNKINLYKANGNINVVKDMIDINNIPTITANDVEIKVGDEFNPKALPKAYDKEDGDLTSKVIVKENNVNTSKAGTYKVVYKVSDSDKNTVTKEIKVTVNNVFTNFTVNNIDNKSTILKGIGVNGSTVKAYVGTKQIGSTVAVNSSGNYSIKIPLQSANTKISVQMSKQGYETAKKTISVIGVASGAKRTQTTDIFKYDAGKGKHLTYINGKGYSQFIYLNKSGNYAFTPSSWMTAAGLDVSIPKSTNGYTMTIDNNYIQMYNEANTLLNKIKSGKIAKANIESELSKIKDIKTRDVDVQTKETPSARVLPTKTQSKDIFKYDVGKGKYLTYINGKGYSQFVYLNKSGNYAFTPSSWMKAAGLNVTMPTKSNGYTMKITNSHMKMYQKTVEEINSYL